MMGGISGNLSIWLIIGFSGQGCFFTRFLIQYIVSERRRRSTIPILYFGILA